MAVVDLLARIVDLALPPRCPGCGAIVVARDRFCVGCWSSLRFIGPPWCALCRWPLDHDDGGERLCTPCTDRPPRHGAVLAAVAYGPVARTLALGLKYGGRTGHAVTAAHLMARHVPDDATLLVPVPLHRGRLWSRSYNQAALIAQALGRRAAVPVDVAALERVRATVSLRGLSGAERRRAVAGAFRVAAPAQDRLAGQRIVLVDDVFTSGATADACIDELLGAGAARVDVLAWARVLDTVSAD